MPERTPFDWTGMQSALDPAGLGASLVASMWWIALAVFTVVWLLVLAAFLYAVYRRRGAAPATGAERSAGRSVAAASAATVLILLLFFGLNLYVGHRTALAGATATQRIEVRGHQWWWEIRYLDEQPQGVFVTANELHLPAGETTRLVLESADVVHSFWVPNLHGKVDMIPGRRNVLNLRPERPGVYRAQCAEFCGAQHAKMALMVVVHPRAGYDQWRAAQLAPAAPPSAAGAARGQQVFLRRCSACHAVRGTPAGGRVGPDLTHVAGRLTIGAGILPNTPGHLGGWVANPQDIKPGNRMPYVPMGGDDLRAVLAYLGTLE